MRKSHARVQDEVTRVIQDAVDPTIYNEIKDWTVGEFREWILADTTTSSFDYGDLKKRKMTVYLVMPPNHLRAQSGWLRSESPMRARR